MSDTDVVQEIQLVQYDEAGRELKLQATEQVFTNVPRNPGESTSVIYYIPAALNTVTIRSESHIGYGAFMNCSMLEHINLYSDKDFDSNGNIVMTVQEIGHYAFYGCMGLREMYIPRNVTILESYTFGNCHNIEQISLPIGLTKVGEKAFMNCVSLRNLVIPKTVTDIGASIDGEYNGAIFEGCMSLENLSIPFVGQKAIKLTDEDPSAYSGLGWLFGSTKPAYDLYSKRMLLNRFKYDEVRAYITQTLKETYDEKYEKLLARYVENYNKTVDASM